MSDDTEKIMVEAIGTRKGIGELKFVPMDGWFGDVAEMDANTANHLLEGEAKKHKDIRIFRRARVKKPVKVSKGE